MAHRSVLGSILMTIGIVIVCAILIIAIPVLIFLLILIKLFPPFGKSFKTVVFSSGGKKYGLPKSEPQPERPRRGHPPTPAAKDDIIDVTAQEVKTTAGPDKQLG